MGEARPDGGATRLATAYARGEGDATYVARLAALDAVARYGGNDARELAKRALADREWPVRVRAAELLRELGDADAQPERPALLRFPAEVFESERVLRPKYSPHVFIETRHGTIEFELNVVDAPFTSMSFVELARAGFFNGVRVHRLIPNFVIQTGDPRGDGEGGPGYTIRDEFSPQPYVRGTVGMALAGKDTRRQPVLHHGLAAAPSGRQVHGLRPGRQRLRAARSPESVGRDRARAHLGRRENGIILRLRDSRFKIRFKVQVQGSGFCQCRVRGCGGASSHGSVSRFDKSSTASDRSRAMIWRGP